MGWELSFTWNCALIFVHFPKPPENTQGNFCLSSCFNFSVLVIDLSNLRQNVLIGQPQRLNFSIQSVPNRLSVLFSTYVMIFFVIPFKVTVRTTSPKMFILSPVTEPAVFFVLTKSGLFRRRHVCKFNIEGSESRSSWNFTVSLKILIVIYLCKFPSFLSPDCVYLILFLGFLNFFGIPTTRFSFLLGKTSSSVGHHRYNMVLVVDFFVYSYFVCRKCLIAQFYFSLTVGNSVSVCS